MRIEHIAMYVNDLELVKDFFIKYFNAVPNKGYHNKITNFRSYFLSFEDGTRLEIMKKPLLVDEKSPYLVQVTFYIHIAFSLGTKNAVDKLTERMKNDGFYVPISIF